MLIIRLLLSHWDESILLSNHISIKSQQLMSRITNVIRPFTECLMRAHPVHSDFRLSESVDSYVNNLENGVILSYINYEIKIVAIQKSVLYNDGNLAIILSAFVSPENDRRKRYGRFCKRYLQYYLIAFQARLVLFGHSHQTISVYIRWHCRWLNLCLRRLFSFLGYWLSFNFIHVH